MWAWTASFHGQGGGGASVSIQRDVLLNSRDFQVLAKGNKPFRYCVTATIQGAGGKGGQAWFIDILSHGCPVN
jgi:hypothetical protein